MLADLNQFYKAQGISAIDFKCPYFKACSKNSPDGFTTSKEAFISSGYVSHELPRVLFLSLDSGIADKNPEKKTLESVRIQEEIDQNVYSLPKNKHWYRTHELAYSILRHFKDDLTIGDVKHYFAHTNSAKCCMNNPGRAEANSILFSNCREFIPCEIELLDPDILITQGAQAKTVVLSGFNPKNLHTKTTVPEEVKMISMSGHDVIWIHTFHPRNPNSKRNRDNFPLYEKLILEFMNYPDKIVNTPEKITQKKNPDPESLPNKKKRKVKCEGNYIWLDINPPTPVGSYPTLEECVKYEFIQMSQLCEITERHGLKRSPACNAFGGDKGKFYVVSERVARAVCHGNTLRKYVLTSAAIDYLKEVGITNW